MNKNHKFKSNELIFVSQSGPYTYCREVTKRFRVEPGNYVIGFALKINFFFHLNYNIKHKISNQVPSMYEQNSEGEFLLRIFTERVE